MEAGFAGSGSLSGPFCPQPARIKAKTTRRTRIIGAIMTESEFHRAVDGVLSRLEDALEREDALDLDSEGGVLTIGCAGGARIIVNRQVPLREIWVAAPSGGFHYRHDGGAWVDTRGGGELFSALAALLARHGGTSVDFA